VAEYQSISYLDEPDIMGLDNNLEEATIMAQIKDKQLATFRIELEKWEAFKGKACLPILACLFKAVP